MDVSTFFSEKNPLGIFREPLSMNGGDDFRIMYCPMQFKKRLKIALSREPGGPGSGQRPWMGRYDKVPSPRSHWCHFTYHTFSEDPGIPSWTPGQVSSALASLWDSKKLGQDPKPTEGNQEIDKTVSLAAGEKVCLADIDGAGSIASVKIGIEPLTEETLFQTWIKMTWDGKSVGAGRSAAGRLLRRLPEGDECLLFLLAVRILARPRCTAIFPCRYWKSAKIEIENRGKQDIKSLKASIQYKPAAAQPYPQKECGYFYAHYNREFPRTEGHDYTYLDWNGRGHVVGHTTSRYDTCMEEDERTYFDRQPLAANPRQRIRGRPQHGLGIEEPAARGVRRDRGRRRRGQRLSLLPARSVLFPVLGETRASNLRPQLAARP